MITDRTRADVDYANTEILKVQKGGAPSDEYFRGFKGRYNISDLNRVETAVRNIAGTLNGQGYSVEVETKINWAVTDIFYEADLQRYLNNLNKLKAAYYVMSTTPQTPANYAPYTSANDIEQILTDIDSLIASMISAFRICGDFALGVQDFAPNIDTITIWRGVNASKRTWAELRTQNATWAEIMKGAWK